MDEDQKFSHLQPGKLSENLRDALGLDDNELPPYIYKMRSLGYPPGWIAEFQEKSSDLCLFDIEGKDMNKSKSKRTILDKNNIIDYPGFNVPMEKGVKDVGKLCYDKFFCYFFFFRITSTIGALHFPKNSAKKT